MQTNKTLKNATKFREHTLNISAFLNWSMYALRFFILSKSMAARWKSLPDKIMNLLHSMLKTFTHVDTEVWFASIKPETRFLLSVYGDLCDRTTCIDAGHHGINDANLRSRMRCRLQRASYSGKSKISLKKWQHC